MSTPRSLVLLVLILCMGTTGCDRARSMWDEVRGGGEQTTEVDEAEQRLRVERELAELALLEAERAERERLETEQRRRELEAADVLVVEWADKLEADKAENGAFVAYEGLTQEDPWGRPLRVEYSDASEEDSQTLEVRSAGPNGRFDDDDDVLRTRTSAVDHGWWARNKIWVIGGFIWFGLGFVSAGGLTRRRHRKKGREDEGLDSTDIILSLVHIAVAPLSMLFWLLVLIIEVAGEILD